MSTESVLSAIDRTLEDYDVGIDAMRWQPDVIVDAPRIRRTSWEPLRRELTVDIDTSAFVAAMQEVIRAVNEMPWLANITPAMLANARLGSRRQQIRKVTDKKRRGWK